MSLQTKANEFNQWLHAEMTVSATDARAERLKVYESWKQNWQTSGSPESWLCDSRNIEFWDLYEAKHGEVDRFEIPVLTLAFQSFHQNAVQAKEELTNYPSLKD